MFFVTPFTLNFVTYKQLKYLPNTPCIYVIVQDDLIWYIGSTINLKKRFSNHHVFATNKKYLLNPFVFYVQVTYYKPFKTLYYNENFVYPSLLKIEKQLIIKYQPFLNKVYTNSNKRFYKYWSDVGLNFTKEIKSFYT